jgi:hypothetical protein
MINSGTKLKYEKLNTMLSIVSCYLLDIEHYLIASN